MPIAMVRLKNPEWTNSHTVNRQQIVQHSRNGEVFAFKRTPVYEYFKMEFKRVSETMFNDLITFLKASAGNYITMFDHKGVQWRCLILTDPVDLVNDARNGCSDQYTVTLEFEGTRV